MIVEGFGVARQEHAGVVHQNIDALKLRGRGAHGMLNIPGVAHIRRDGHAARAKFAGCSFQLWPVAPADHHLGAFAHKGSRNGFTDAAPATGNDGGLAA